MSAHTATASPAISPLTITPLSDVMAAEVIGIDLSSPLDEAARAAIHAAFLDHQILVFRGQKLTKEQQVAFSEQFGTLERHTQRNQGTNDHPLVHVVSNLGADGKPMGRLRSDQWHSDKSFRPAPSMATILHAITLPPTGGGDTVFANMYHAYETLPATDKSALEGVQVIHSWPDSRENIGRVMSQEEIDDAPPMAHPLARVHPDTGRTALFLGVHAAYLDGREFTAEDRASGLARIEQLEAHATRDDFIYRHDWREGDVLMWDNRCLLHRADANFDAALHPRILHRTCIRGTPTA